MNWITNRLGYKLAAFALLILAVSGAAWMVQGRPRWTASVPPPGPGDVTNADYEILRFARKDPARGVLQGVWELDAQGRDTGYELEVEPNTRGAYYFPFQNLL